MSNPNDIEKLIRGAQELVSKGGAGLSMDNPFEIAPRMRSEYQYSDVCLEDLDFPWVEECTSKRTIRHAYKLLESQAACFPDLFAAIKAKWRLLDPAAFSKHVPGSLNGRSIADEEDLADVASWLSGLKEDSKKAVLTKVELPMSPTRLSPPVVLDPFSSSEYVQKVVFQSEYSSPWSSEVLFDMEEMDEFEALDSTARTFVSTNYKNMGNDHFHAGENEDALLCYKRAFFLDDKRGDVLHNLALVLIRKGQTHDALDVLKLAVLLQPTYAKAYFRLSVLSETLRNVDAAYHYAWLAYLFEAELDNNETSLKRSSEYLKRVQKIKSKITGDADAMEMKARLEYIAAGVQWERKGKLCRAVVSRSMFPMEIAYQRDHFMSEKHKQYIDVCTEVCWMKKHTENIMEALESNDVTAIMTAARSVVQGNEQSTITDAISLLYDKVSVYVKLDDIAKTKSALSKLSERSQDVKQRSTSTVVSGGMVIEEVDDSLDTKVLFVLQSEQVQIVRLLLSEVSDVYTKFQCRENPRKLTYEQVDDIVRAVYKSDVHAFMTSIEKTNIQQECLVEYQREKQDFNTTQKTSLTASTTSTSQERRKLQVVEDDSDEDDSEEEVVILGGDKNILPAKSQQKKKSILIEEVEDVKPSAKKSILIEEVDDVKPTAKKSILIEEIDNE